MPGPNSWHGNKTPPTRFMVEVCLPVGEGDLLEGPFGGDGYFRVVAAGGVDEDGRRTEGFLDSPMRGVEVFLSYGVGGEEKRLCPPWLESFLTRAWPRSSLRPSTAIFAPAWARPSARAPPKAPVAPITTATSPERSKRSMRQLWDKGHGEKKKNFAVVRFRRQVNRGGDGSSPQKNSWISIARGRAVPAPVSRPSSSKVRKTRGNSLLASPCELDYVRSMISALPRPT